jgi:hypothetical protein
MAETRAFRYETVTYSGGVDQYDDPIPGVPEIVIRTFFVEKFTPKGFRVGLGNGSRFVNTSAQKQYAHLDPKDALIAYRERRKSEERILRKRLADCVRLREDAERRIVGLENPK